MGNSAMNYKIRKAILKNWVASDGVIVRRPPYPSSYNGMVPARAMVCFLVLRTTTFVNIAVLILARCRAQLSRKTFKFSRSMPLGITWATVPPTDLRATPCPPA